MRPTQKLPIALFLIAFAAACSSGAAEEPYDAVNFDVPAIEAAANAAAEEPATAPPEPTHLYQTREGDLYGYVGAVSEEDRKRGVAVGKVHMFRFEGVNDGLYGLTAFDASGRATASYECSKPCVAIKAYTWSGTERWAFNPESVIGAAFTDALNGHLAAYRPKPPAPPAQPVAAEPTSNEAAASVNVSSEAEADVPSNEMEAPDYPVSGE